MKKALIVVVLLITLLLGLPLADGFWVKKKYYALNKLASERTPLSLQILAYHRGWFTSTATLKVSSTPLGNNRDNALNTADNNHFVVKETLYHGPLILRSNKPFDRFGKSLTLALALSEIRVNQTDLRLSSLAVYHYNGSVDIKFDCPTITYPLGQSGENFNLKGLRGDFSFTKRFKHSTGQISLLNADIPLHDGHQRLSNISYRYSLDKNPLDLWSGNRSLKIGNLELNFTEKLQLQNAAFSLTDNSDAHQLDSSLEVQVGNLKHNNTDLGKQQFIFKISHLDLASLLELGQKADLLDQQAANLSTRALELTPIALQLLSEGLYVNLSSVDLNTQWGNIRGNASLDIAKQEHPHTEFTTVLANTTAQADVTFPVKLLEDILALRYQAMTTPEEQKQSENSPQAMVKDTIDRWILAGWLIPSGNQYQVNLAYKTNQLLLNGKPIKVPSLPISENTLSTSQR